VRVGDPDRVVAERLGQLGLADDRRHRLVVQETDVELHGGREPAPPRIETVPNRPSAALFGYTVTGL
jgi:hypothetical protein